MKARTWFYARGASLKARGYKIREAAIALRLDAAPEFARKAVADAFMTNTPRLDRPLRMRVGVDLPGLRQEDIGLMRALTPGSRMP